MFGKNISKLKQIFNKLRMNVGDVFCMEIKGEYKLYFQYIGEDRAFKSGALIRVFKSRYNMDQAPEIERIINDEVMFYAHSLISDGIDAGAWYKFGSSTDLGLEELQGIWFGKTLESIVIPAKPPYEIKNIDRLKYWQLWQFNGETIETDGIFRKANEIINPEITYPGFTYPYHSIMELAKLGYCKETAIEYDILKRVPHDYTDSYVRISDYEVEYMFHFKGSEVVREIIIGNGTSIGLSKDFPESGVVRLSEIRFGEINWKEEDFINREEFDKEWQREGVMRVPSLSS